MRYVVGVLVFLAAILLTIILLGGSIFDYLNLPTIFFLLLPIVAVIIMKGGTKTFIVAVNALLSKKYSISAADKEKAIRLFRLIAKTVTFASALVTLISLLNMATGINLTDNDDVRGVILPNVAASFVAVFYGLLINMVFIYPAIEILESRHDAEVKTVISEKQVVDKLLELCYKQGVSPEEILDASEISFRKKQ